VAKLANKTLRQANFTTLHDHQTPDLLTIWNETQSANQFSQHYMIIRPWSYVMRCKVQTNFHNIWCFWINTQAYDRHMRLHPALTCVIKEANQTDTTSRFFSTSTLLLPLNMLRQTAMKKQTCKILVNNSTIFGTKLPHGLQVARANQWEMQQAIRTSGQHELWRSLNQPRQSNSSPHKRIWGTKTHENHQIKII